MRKIYQLQNLDCANCAAKIEKAVLKINGIKSASVNFLSQKMILEADETEFERIIKEVVKICKKMEPDCKILF